MSGLAASAAPASAAPAAPAAAPAAQPAVSAEASRGKLVLIRPDGSEGESFPIGDTTVVGREASGPFASDSYLSPRHAEFVFRGASLWVRDLESLNGVYMLIERDTPIELKEGEIFRIGQEILRFESMSAPKPGADGVELMGSPNPGFLGRIRLVIGRESHGNTYCIPPTGMHLGRERGDIIFPDDGYVSGLHCRLHGEGGKMFLTDVGSSNGTFVRVEGDREVKSGARLLMGQQLFKAEY